MVKFTFLWLASVWIAYPFSFRYDRNESCLSAD